MANNIGNENNPSWTNDLNPCDNNGILTDFHANSDPVRLVPLDLFPMNEGGCNDAWARNTFRYAYMFTSQIIKESFDETTNDLKTWCTVAKKIVIELKQLGMSEGNNHLIKTARKEYNLKLPNSDIEPTSVHDILTCISDKDWYNDEKESKLRIIYILMYGIHRIGLNNWAVLAEKEWMQSKNIKYDIKYDPSRRKQKLRGCIYSLICSQFSNSITKQFKGVMQRTHGEFLAVRDKTTQNNDGYEYKKMTFPGGHGYLVICPERLAIEHEDKKKKIEKEVERVVQKCKRANIFKQELHDMVDECFEKNPGKF